MFISRLRFPSGKSIAFKVYLNLPKGYDRFHWGANVIVYRVVSTRLKDIN